MTTSTSPNTVIEHKPDTPTNPVLCAAVDVAISFALSLCAPGIKRSPSKRPAPAINIHASADELRKQFESVPTARPGVHRKRSTTQEGLVMRQIKFRNEYRAARRKREEMCALHEERSIGEWADEAAIHMRITVAAVLVLQSYARTALASRGEGGGEEAPDEGRRRLPVYLRDGWVAPTPAEFDERLAALAVRFPGVPAEAVEQALRDCVGHAGHAAAELAKAARALAPPPLAPASDAAAAADGDDGDDGVGPLVTPPPRKPGQGAASAGRAWPSLD